MEPESFIKQIFAGRYDIQAIIGKGGMATVYKAIQVNLGRPVALKVIHGNIANNDEFISCLKKEARICSLFNHQNIVTIYDVGSIGTTHFISMEYLEGMTLHELIRRKGKLSVNETVNCISPIAEVLGLMHKQNIIHRDVKSSNIIITNTGKPVLMDFGIVCSDERDQFNADGSVFGTPEYMSPEQVEGKHNLDGRSDLYSLGVVIFECLTAKLPFTGETYLTVLDRVKHSSPPSLTSVDSRIPSWISSIVSECLKKDRSLRLNDGFLLAKRLRNRGKLNPDPIRNPFSPKTIVIIAIIVIAILILVIGLVTFGPLESSSMLGSDNSSNKGATVRSVPKPGSTSTTPSNSKIPVETETPVIAVPNVKKPDPDLQKRDSVQELISSGDALCEKGAFETALTRYADAQKLDTANAGIKRKISEARSKWILSIVQQGDGYLKNNEFAQALSKYNQALKIDPVNNEIKQKITETKSRFAQEFISQADAQFVAHDYDLALSNYQTAKGINPSDARIDTKINKVIVEKKTNQVQQNAAKENSRKEEILKNLGISMIKVESLALGMYYIGDSEVTQQLWNAVMGSNPSNNKGNRLPVESVSYNDVQAFFNRLNQMTGLVFRLPTEAEWEFAAQGGNKSQNLKYSGSARLSEVAWYDANSNQSSRAVKALGKNELGFFDMSGNVWEWCSTRENGKNVVKGGSWMSPKESCAISNRKLMSPEERDDTIGFRLCRSE